MTAALTAAAVVVPLGVGVAVASTEPAVQVPQTGGAAWLVSAGQSLVTLVDGPAERVVGAVRLGDAEPGDDLAVHQHGTSALVLNTTRGTLTPVDGATWEVGDTAGIGPAGSSLTLHSVDDAGGDGARPLSDAGGDGAEPVVVVDATTRSGRVLDPATMAVSAPIALSGQPGHQQTVMDPTGTLWLVDAQSGAVTSIDATTDPPAKRIGADSLEPSTRLVVVGDRPVAVDAAGRRLGPLRTDGTVGAWSCLDVPADPDLQLLGSDVGDTVLAVSPRTGTLRASGVAGDDCDQVLVVASPGDDLGPAVGQDRFVLLPNRTAGSVVVVDTAAGNGTGEVVDEIPLAEPGAALELVPAAETSLVFYHDRDSDLAGVLKLDGGRWTSGEPLQKFGDGIATLGEATTAQNPTTLWDGTGPSEGAVDRTPDPGLGTDDRDQEPPPQATGSLPPLSGSPAGPGSPMPPGAAGAAGGPSPRGGGPADAPGPGGAPAPVVAIDSLTPSVTTASPGDRVIVTAAASGAGPAGLSWQWQATDEAGTRVASGTDPERFAVTVPDGTASLTVRLTVRGPGGSQATDAVQIAVGTPRPGAVSVSCTTASAGLGQSVRCTGSMDSGTPPPGDWTWTTDGAGGVTRATQPPGTPFTFRSETPGTYTITVAAGAGPTAPTSTAATVAVSDTCTLGGPVAVDLGTDPTVGASGTAQIPYSGCHRAQDRDAAVSGAPGWLTVSVSAPDASDGSLSVVLTIADAGYPDGARARLTATLPNGQPATVDATANRSPTLSGRFGEPAPSCIVLIADAIRPDGSRTAIVSMSVDATVTDADLASVAATLSFSDSRGGLTGPFPGSVRSDGAVDARVVVVDGLTGETADLPDDTSGWILTVTDGNGATATASGPAATTPLTSCE